MLSNQFNCHDLILGFDISWIVPINLSGWSLTADSAGLGKRAFHWQATYVVIIKSCGMFIIPAVNSHINNYTPGVTARFVTRFNLWLRHDLWPQNASICDPARFVTKSASICDQRYTMILESKLCRGKLVFVFTLIMNATWYNMMHIYIWTVL